MGIIGHGVDEENNAVLIVVQDLNDEIRSEIAKYISDTDEIVFEVGEKIFLIERLCRSESYPHCVA